MKLELAAKQPFSLFSVIHSHGWVRLAPFNHVENTGEFTYLHTLEDQRVVRLVFEEIPGGVSVETSDPVAKSQQHEISQTVNWMLGLDQDFSKFYELAEGEPKLQNVAASAKGRILRSATLFEDTIKTILTTNTAWSGTIRMVANLVEQFGEKSVIGNSGMAFPSPEAIAAADEGILREETRLGYRSPYILDLAQKIVSGDLDLEYLKEQDLTSEEVRERLLKIKGVGNYAAANLLMLLGHYGYLTIDSWALKMVSNEWYGGEPITPREVEAAFERWGQWKGLAYWLWDWSFKGE